MRLLEIKQLLTEAKLAASEIPANKKSTFVNPKTKEVFSRPELFLHKVKNRLPFTKLDGEQVIINPKEAAKVADWITSDPVKGPSGTISLTTIDGDIVKNTDLLKTAEFGSSESENIPVKPTDIFSGEDIDPESEQVLRNLQKAGAFPVRDLYSRIVDNPALDKLGNIGKAIKEMTEQINSKQIPTLPAYLKQQEKKAISKYSGEYLGVLSMFNGIAEFPLRAEFDEFLGSDLGDLQLFFPRSVSNPLADSYAIKNRKDGHTIRISSKAEGKGAPPSLAGLKIPAHIKDDPKFANEVRFLEAAQSKEYSTATQPFYLHNLLFEIAPDTLNENLYPYLPWTAEWIDQIVPGLSDGRTFPARDMKTIASTLPGGRSAKAVDAGVIWYAATVDIMNAVNKKNALPNFKAMVLDVLGYNFIQLYTNITSKGLLKTKVVWPAKVGSNIFLKTKGSAAEPGKGKLGFQVS